MPPEESAMPGGDGIMGKQSGSATSMETLNMGPLHPHVVIALDPVAVATAHTAQGITVQPVVADLSG